MTELTEEKKKRIYLARAKRIWFNAIFAAFFAIIATTCFYYAWIFGQDGVGWRTIALAVLCFVFILLFFEMFQETRVAIVKRGYARPVESSPRFSSIVKSIFTTDTDKAHPVQYQRSKVLVHFDDRSVYEVDLGVLYFVLLDEVNKTTGILSWDRCVVKNKMDKRAWAAYRKLLQDANVVSVDGRGGMQLNCQPWAAIEAIKERC